MLDAAALLRSVPLFGDLDDRSCASLANHATQGVVRGGAWLFHEGETADLVHLVLSGRLEAIHENDGTHVRLFGPGDVVGELAVLTRSRRTASVRAIRDSRLLSVAAADLQVLLGEDPAFGAALLHNLAERLGDSLPRRGPDGPPPTVMAVDGGTGSPTAELPARLVPALGDDATLLDDRTAGSDFGASLDRAERAHGLVVLDCGPAVEGSWREFALRKADRVLTVVRAGDPAPAGETIWWGAPARVPPSHGGKRFVVRPDAHLGGDVRRVARRLRGRSIGLVLSGGGARAPSPIWACCRCWPSGASRSTGWAGPAWGRSSPRS